MKSALQASGLLLVSRVLSIGLNLATQVLTIHYLTQLDYGVLAFALLVFETSSIVPVLGLDRALTRVVPGLIVDGHGLAFRKAMQFIVRTVLAIAVLFSLVVWGVIHSLDLAPAQLLAVLVLFVLLPLGACDRLLESTLAALQRSDEIAKRKYMYRPVMRVTLVGCAIALDGGLTLIAAAYSATMIFGTLFYASAALRALRSTNLDMSAGDFAQSRSELIAYAKPQYGSDLTLLAQSTTISTLLTLLAGNIAMASFAAIMPFARLNHLVMEAFEPVYTPGAAQLIAQRREAQVNDFFWRTTAWAVAVSFPVLAMTTVFADVLVATFLDDRYAWSATLLTICSIGFFSYVSFGFTSYQLRVEGHGSRVFRADVRLLVFETVMAIALIAQWGATGAAIAMAVSLSAHGLTKRYLLKRYSTLIDFSGFLPCVKRVYLPLLALLVTLTTFGHVWGETNLLLALTLTGIAWLALLRWARPVLELGHYFPVLTQIPVARWFV